MDYKTQYPGISTQGEKLLEGLQLAFKRLVEKAKLEDDYLVFSENGKPYKVRARDLK